VKITRRLAALCLAMVAVAGCGSSKPPLQVESTPPHALEEAVRRANQAAAGKPETRKVELGKVKVRLTETTTRFVKK
jgi:hypothetical protein